MESSQQVRSAPWFLMVVFLLFIGITLFSGLSFYRFLQQRNLSEAQKNLISIADLKVQVVIDWRSEQIRVGRIIQRNVPLVRSVESFIKSKSKEQVTKDLLTSFQAIVESYGYESIVLTDEKGNGFISTNPASDSIGNNGRLAIKEAVEKLFLVKVEKVRTSNVHGKEKRVGTHFGRKSDWKKAVVSLAKGYKIDFLENL